MIPKFWRLPSANPCPFCFNRSRFLSSFEAYPMPVKADASQLFDIACILRFQGLSLRGRTGRDDGRKCRVASRSSIKLFFKTKA
jgi:hypothetical protein